MNFLEKDLEDIIYETDNAKLRERGLPIYGLKLRQIRLGSYGVADLITVQLRSYNETNPEDNITYYFGHKLIVTIYELKQNLIDFKALGQCLRYSKAIDEILSGLDVQIYDIHDYELKHVIVGSKVDTSNDFVYLVNHTYLVKAFTYNYGFDGLSFRLSSGWHKEYAVDKIVSKLNDRNAPF